MESEKMFYKKLIENYRLLIQMCLSEIRTSNDPYWWEEKKIICDMKIMEAERMINIMDYKETYNQIKI